MASSLVVTPDGTRWRVQRRWRPHQMGGDSWWRRVAARFARHGDFASDGGGVADGLLHVLDDGFVAAIAVAAVVGFVLLFVFPVLAVAVEITYLLLLLLGGVVARLVFRRPWTIEAVSSKGLRFEYPVVGWRPSTAAREYVVAELRANRVPGVDEVQRAARRRP